MQKLEVRGQTSRSQKSKQILPQLVRFRAVTPNLNWLMATKWCTIKLEVVQKRCPAVFQGPLSNFKVTHDKKLPNFTRIEHYQAVIRVWIHWWLWNNGQSLTVVSRFPHRENSTVTRTTPEPTLLSWGGWPCETHPPLAMQPNPVLSRLSATQTPLFSNPLMLPIDTQVCHERQICWRFHWILKVILEMGVVVGGGGGGGGGCAMGHESVVKKATPPCSPYVLILNPIWVRLQVQSQLLNPSDLPFFTFIRVSELSIYSFMCVCVDVGSSSWSWSW